MTYHGNDVAIVCNQSREIFYITCGDGDVWVGETGNCTTPAKRTSEEHIIYTRASRVLRGLLGMVNESSSAVLRWRKCLRMSAAALCAGGY